MHERLSLSTEELIVIFLASMTTDLYVDVRRIESPILSKAPRMGFFFDRADKHPRS